MGVRAILAVLAAGGLAGAAAAESPAKEPYPWRVVLAAGRHPVLGPAFRDQLARDLRAALQGAVGPVAAVEVIDLAAVPKDRWDPLWVAFAARGWPALDPDPKRELTGVKTHVLTVEFRDGQFHLEAKQHDGFTGLATPVLRRQTVRSADMVARLFDTEWTEHPAGSTGAVFLAAARRIAALQGGTLDGRLVDGGGCRLVLTLPAAE